MTIVPFLGWGCVCLGLQRPALIPFHTQELRLIDGEGQWELRSIHSGSAEPSEASPHLGLAPIT